MRQALLQSALIVVFSAGLAAAWGICHPLPTIGVKGQYVTVDTALSWGDSVQWVDARGSEAYVQGRIRNAMPLTFEDFNKQYRALVRTHKDGQKIVVYCVSATCPRADYAANELRDKTHWPDIYVLEGGWDAWLAHGAK